MDAYLDAEVFFEWGRNRSEGVAHDLASWALPCTHGSRLQYERLTYTLKNTITLYIEYVNNKK